MIINFDDTKIAFQGKSNIDLRKTQQLFKLIGNPKLVKFGEKLVKFSFQLHLPIKWLIRNTIFKQFCGGETIEKCNKTTAALHEFNIGTILDYAVEGKEDNSTLDEVVEEIIATIHKAKDHEAIPFSVFKPTGISQFSILEKANDSINNLSKDEKKAYDKIVERFDKICNAAFQHQVPIFIDAEDSWIQHTIDRICEQMMERYNQNEVIVYTTIQFYRWDRLTYLKDLHQRAKEKQFKIGVKLVRGAYLEKERERARRKGYQDPIQVNKQATDGDYNLALAYCIDHLSDISVCAGTHNEASCQLLVDLMGKKNLNANDQRVYFAQLLGMSDHISFNLSHAGYNVAKYVPYGPIQEVLPYLIRRAEENTSVAGQTSRELTLIAKEIKRRKHVS